MEILMILYIIIECLKSNKTEIAYMIFLKAYQNYSGFDAGLIIYSGFDAGLIIYIRLVLYNYISKYKNYFYNLEYRIEIGHLLLNFLLKINSEAEKIIIYLSPIILRVNFLAIYFSWLN
jgi:hypothetical protein